MVTSTSLLLQSCYVSFPDPIYDIWNAQMKVLIMCICRWVILSRAVAIRFGVIRLVVRAQERYTLEGPGGMLPQENFEI